jgi:o-succinylbenzoate synthase
LILEDDRGRRGIGEASPLPGYSKDTLDSGRAELAAVDWSRPELPSFTSPAAQFAAETARFDLTGRQVGRSIAELLGRTSSRVALSSIVNADDDAGIIGEIHRAIARGIHTVKLKVGRMPLAQDLYRIGLIRHTFGDRIQLRLDANQAWTLEQAQVALGELERYSPELVEEPVAVGDWPALVSRGPQGLARRVPLALDESLQELTLDQVRALAASGTVAALVLKPMALGGFSRCLELARLAVQLDLACVVTHLFDGPVALAAAAELALALPGRVLACGLDRHRGLQAWPSWPVPQIGATEIAPSTGLGLGVEVNP